MRAESYRRLPIILISVGIRNWKGREAESSCSLLQKFEDTAVRA